MTNVNTTFAALPIATSLTGAEVLPVDQGGTTKQTTAGAIGALASVGQFTSTFITVTANPILVNSRIIAVGASLSLTDGGALGNLTVGTGALSGDVTSAANSFVTTVAKINGVALGATTATAGNILIGSGAQWVTQSVTGDISLTAGGSVTVGAINGSALGITTPTAANLLIGSGTQWVTHAITGDISITSAGSVSVNSVHSGVFANPTGTVGLTAVNGALTTAMRSDAAPALSQAIIPTWTGTHTFTNAANAAIFNGGPVGFSVAAPQAGVYAQFGNPTLIDSTVWGASVVNFGRDSTSTVNQWVVAVQFNAKASGAVANYEKAAGIFITEISDISGAHTFDGVGIDMRGYIANTNTLGRAWGGYSEADILSGGVADGMLIAHEFHTTNNGTDQAAVSTTTSKYGGMAVADGSAPSTAAFLATNLGAATWHHGFYMDPASLAAAGTANFITLNGKFTIDKNGILSQSTNQTGSIVNFQTSANGSIFATWACIPAAGAANDSFGINFNFSQANGTQYQGAIFRAVQSVATAGAQTTIMQAFTVNAGGAITENLRLSGAGGLSIGNSVVATDPGSGGILGGGSVKSASPTGGVGYAPGAGSTVTQLTNRNTGVTINNVTGSITLVSTIGSATPATCVVSNTTTAPSDTVLVGQKSGTDKYTIGVTAISSQGFSLTFFTSGATTESPVFNFAVIKGSSV